MIKNSALYILYTKLYTYSQENNKNESEGIYW